MMAADATVWVAVAPPVLAASVVIVVLPFAVMTVWAVLGLAVASRALTRRG